MKEYRTKVKGVIFDFDGVIINSEKLKFNILKKLLREKNVDTKKIKFEEKTGTTLKHYLEFYFKNELSKREIEEIRKKQRELESKKIDKLAYLYPKVREILALLQKKQVKICLGTGSKRSFVKRILKKLHLFEYFDAIIANEDYFRDKPFPDVFLKCLEKLKLPRKKCVVIEDSVWGVKAAKEAGIFTIAICTNFPSSSLKEADLIVKNHQELLKKLKELL